VLAAAVLLVAAGCGMDVAKQLTTNEQLRTQVMDTIAANPALRVLLVDKLMATDSTRIAVVDKLLANDEVAKQVIVRVAMSPSAVDMVIGSAMRDSTMREHVLTLFKGIQMASAKK
jgi:hypothetical protein